MRHSQTVANAPSMAKAIYAFGCSVTMAASILIISALSILLGVILVLVILAGVLVLIRDPGLTERNR